MVDTVGTQPAIRATLKRGAMNIFVLDLNISKCAKYHCDRHVVKMILESAQMLSTALRLNGLDLGYQVAHQNHPCTVWTRASLSNWKWLRELAKELNLEYKYRFNKIENHKSWDLIQTLPAPPIKDAGLTPFAQAMPVQYKNENPVLAYRSFYIGEKFKLFQWTKRKTPSWICKNSILSLQTILMNIL